MAKNKVIISVVIIFVIIAGLYLFIFGNDKKDVKEAFEVYLNAVKEKNFNVVYSLNAAAQRRVIFIKKGSDANKDELLKQAYNEQKALFDSVQAVYQSNTIWSEKTIFISDMNYRITRVAMEADIDNPTAFYRKRIDATVEIEVEYVKTESAPAIEGRSVKKAIYIVKMIHNKNIGKTIKAMSVTDDKWLFKGISIKEGSVVYW